MRNSLEITFKGIVPNPRLTGLIHEKFKKIQGIAPDITKCHIILELLSKHHQKGNAYCVRLDLKVPHLPDIVVCEESKQGETPLRTAVRDVFKKSHTLIRKHIERRNRKKSPPS